MKVIEEIARGGFGRVDKIRMPDGTTYARKTFSPTGSFSDDELQKFKKRFIREVRTQKALKSASFLPVLGEDLDANEPWFLMPLAERSLQAEIIESKSTGNVPNKALADLMNALEELHQLGMVHRDLKPQNVLLLDGQWKLSDFGLVLPQSSETTQLTSTNSAWGTVNYAAPEQAVGFHHVTPAADIYAFGCVLHDIFGVNQRVPYARHSAPGQIGAIIEKCTELDPKRRFKSIHAVRGALLTALATTTTTTVGLAASQWVKRIPGCSSWTSDDVTSFARDLSHLSDFNDKYAILSLIDESVIDTLHKINQESWKNIAIEYCNWAEGGFEFSYCDVIIGRLERIFELGDFEVKACAASAAAELGQSHNRWYVMRQLVRFCGPGLDDQVANRIAIEIQARELETQFEVSARGAGGDIDRYHPAIAATLTKAPEF